MRPPLFTGISSEYEQSSTKKPHKDAELGEKSPISVRNITPVAKNATIALTINKKNFAEKITAAVESHDSIEEQTEESVVEQKKEPPYLNL